MERGISMLSLYKPDAMTFLQRDQHIRTGALARTYRHGWELNNEGANRVFDALRGSAMANKKFVRALYTLGLIRISVSAQNGRQIRYHRGMRSTL
jgi:hypothetical protein